MAVPESLSASTRLVREALEALGIRRLVLGIHDSAFAPARADCGFGSPHASGDDLFAFARALGFDGVQLGPSGQISDANVSPYDATAFSRNVLQLDLAALCEPACGGLLTPEDIEQVLSSEPPPGPRANARHARRVVTRALDLAAPRFAKLRAEQPSHPVVKAFQTFHHDAGEWLELEALYQALCDRLGHDDPSRFDGAIRALFARTETAAENRPRIARNLGAPYERALLAQFLLDTQKHAVRARARAHGIALFGDLQIGWSPRDRFLRPELFANEWSMGAPPSRTNPGGQPWGYPLLDPDQLDDPSSPARITFARLLERMFDAYDGIRIDHPHGLVCPWIYAADDPDPAQAVLRGTRAFESPDHGHPKLVSWAIARREDIDGSVERHADGWVRTLDAMQVTRYGRLLQVVLDVAKAHGRDASSIAIEVLSTCPTPLNAVLAHHGLGRFVVTQKANPDDPRDVYRTEHVRPADWVMLGTHDTPPIFTLAHDWMKGSAAKARAAYLAQRLQPNAVARADAAQRHAASPGALLHAELADLFACEAHNVFIYFTDLFGEREPFNRAGVIHPDNWTLRLPADYAARYAERRDAGEALDLRRALSLALHARGMRPDLQVKLTSTRMPD